MYYSQKNSRNVFGCPLGYLKAKILELHLVDNWDHFLQRVQMLMHMWGHSIHFIEDDQKNVSEAMFHFVIIELNQLKLKLTPYIIPLIEKVWRGHPMK